jgi:hypothetical protein
MIDIDAFLCAQDPTVEKEELSSYTDSRVSAFVRVDPLSRKYDKIRRRNSVGVPILVV